MNFELDFTLPIATQTVEASLLFELNEKDEIFFAEADVTLDLCARGEKEEVCKEVVSDYKKELPDLKTDSAKYLW